MGWVLLGQVRIFWRARMAAVVRLGMYIEIMGWRWIFIIVHSFISYGSGPEKDRLFIWGCGDKPGFVGCLFCPCFLRRFLVEH